MLDPTTGLWVDDELDPAKWNAGDIGAQADAPVAPMPPPPALPGPPPGPPGGFIPAGNFDMQTGAPMPAAPPNIVIPDPISITNDARTPDASLPDVAPYKPQSLAPVPPGRVVSPAESGTLGAIDANTGARMSAAKDEGDLGVLGAQKKADAADQGVTDQASYVAERQRINNEYTQRLADRQKEADADYQKYKAFGIKDPQADDSFGTRILKAIAVGMGQYGASMTHSENTALHILQTANEENIARQKAQQEKLFQVSQQSGKDVDEARKERDDAFRQLDLKHSALLESSAAMLREQLARIGVPQAQIDSNQAVQKIEQDALGIREKTMASIRGDETDLAKADLAAAARRAKAGRGGGGGSDALAQFVAAAGQLAPGDSITPEVATLGLRAGLKPNQIAAEVDRYRLSADKAAALAAAKNKPGGGGVGSVRQNAVLGNLAEAETAAKEIVPGSVSMDSIQKLQSNEEKADAAHRSGESGITGALGVAMGRSLGVVPRGRYDGIPEDQQKKITAAEQVITHLTEMQQGKNIETLQQYRDRYSPYVPGLSQAEILRRERALPGLVAEQRATQDPTGIGSKRLAGIPSRAAPAGGDQLARAQAVVNDKTAMGRLTAAERAKLIQFVRSARSAAPPADNGGNPLDDLTL